MYIYIDTYGYVYIYTRLVLESYTRKKRTLTHSGYRVRCSSTPLARFG